MKKVISILALALLANLAHAQSDQSKVCESAATLSQTMAEARDLGVSMEQVRQWSYGGLTSKGAQRASMVDDINFLSTQVFVVGYSVTPNEIHKTVFAGCMAGSAKAKTPNNIIVPVN